MSPDQSGVPCQISTSGKTVSSWQITEPEALDQALESRKCSMTVVTSSKANEPPNTVEGRCPPNINHDLLATVFNQLPTGMVLIDANHYTVVEANPTITNWLGYSREQLLGLRFDTLIELPHEEVKNLIETTLFQGQHPSSRLVFRCKNGTLVSLEGQSHPILHQESMLICWLVNYSEQSLSTADNENSWQQTHQEAWASETTIHQSKLFQAAQKQVAALEHINQLKDNFLSTISHELRTPIATIKMAIQMLTLALGQEGFLHTPANSLGNRTKIAHYLKILNDECNREIALITDLLDMQRLESGNHSVNIQLVPLKPYLERIIRPFQEQAQIHNQILRLETSEALPSVVSDVQSLERILVELLTNACKYSPCGATIVLRALPSEDPTGLQTLILSVCNSGVEIPPEQLNQIFDKFYRIPDGDPHRYSGTGLGLALVHRLSIHLGGKVFAESGNGKTCFILEIPQVFQGSKPSSAATPVEL